MRFKKGICILCRNRGHPAQVPFIARREASSRSRQDAFDASKLVLDLDAADSKYVRRYEDQRIEDSKSFKAPQNNSLSSRQKAKREKEEAAMLRRQITVPDIYKATDADYLAFALLGDPFDHPSPYTGGLREVLSRNLLSTRIGSFKQQIQWLKDNAERSNFSSLPAGLSLVHQHMTYRSMILNCQNFEHLNRTTTYILKTVPGCEWVSSNGDLIVDVIKYLRRRQDYTKGEAAIGPGQMLKYINALVQKLEKMDLGPGPALCHTGMYYAAKASIYSAVRKYINIAIEKGYISPKQQRQALDVLMFRHAWAQSSVQDSGRREEGRRAGLLELLTGWDIYGRPRETEKRKPCFASLARGNPHMYKAYIASLGRLGAHEALWFELMNLRLPSIREDGFQAMTAEESAEVFFNAFLATSDTSNSRVELESETDNTSRDGLPPNIIPASDIVDPPERLKKREELVTYYQSRLRSMQDDLVKEEANGPQDVLSILEKLLGNA